MRISYLASAVVAICFLPLSMSAFASCNSASCATSGNTVAYSGTLSTPPKYRANTHVSQGISTRYGVTRAAACPSGSTRARDGYCMSNRHSSSVGSANSTSFASSSSYRSKGQTVPFTTSVSKISNYRVAGMGRDEFLSPTTCPVNVYNPGGHKVLGCYSVVKPVRAAKPVQVIRPVPQIRYQQVRVVRPIIYVRYPVPTLMPLPMPIPMRIPVQVPVCRSQIVCGGGCNSTTYSRYGNAWPQVRRTCGGW